MEQEKEESRKQKKSGGRRAYLNDFQANVAGEYIYTGKKIGWKAPREQTLVKMWVLGGLGILASVIAGCIPGTGMEGTAWIVLPYIIGLVAAVSEIWAICRLSTAGEQIREYVFQATAKQLPARSFLTALFSGVAILGEAVNVFVLDFNGKIGAGLLLMFLETVVFVTAILLHRLIMKLEWAE